MAHNKELLLVVYLYLGQRKYVPMKTTKRMLQVAELVKRNMSMVLMQEGTYIYGNEPMVSVTNVVMSADMGIAKVYVSVYNTENKQEVMLLIEGEIHRLRQNLAQRIKKHVRRIPRLDIYIDETIDEMERLNKLFDKLNSEKG